MYCLALSVYFNVCYVSTDAQLVSHAFGIWVWLTDCQLPFYLTDTGVIAKK